jgi:HAD superfamily hydrolase (TIGR01509 family)
LKYLVLDAIGVIYTAHDDVAELLHPFIVEKGGLDDLNRINGIYIEASLGRMVSAGFWRAVGIDPKLEDEYLSRHVITGGLIGFLEEMRLQGVKVWCLSNDVSEWSCKLRRKFEIEGYFQGFIISGDVGLRKPAPAIYELLIDRLKCKANGILFVDDNIRNLDAAERKGIGTVLFNSSGRVITGKHKVASSFKKLGELVR